MGQKVHPKGLRLKIVEDWDNSWFALKEYKDFILEDLKIRKYIDDNLKRAAVSSVKISRRSDKLDVNIKSARTGIIIGKGGDEVIRHRKELSKLIGRAVTVNVSDQKKPEKSAPLIAEGICMQLEKRIPFRRAMKMAMQMAMKAGAEGIKVSCSGRLGGTEIARTEWYREGKVPLHTLRASIDYNLTEAQTTYGKIGVKVWVYNGDIYDHNERQKNIEINELPAPVAAE